MIKRISDTHNLSNLKLYYMIIRLQNYIWRKEVKNKIDENKYLLTQKIEIFTEEKYKIYLQEITIFKKNN